MLLAIGFFDFELINHLLPKATLMKAKIIIVADGRMIVSILGTNRKSKNEASTTMVTRTNNRFFITLPPLCLFD